MDKYIELKGGIDSQTPQIAVDGGSARYISNMYESVNGGYTTIKGHEMLDNWLLPSNSTWTKVTLTLLTGDSADSPLEFMPTAPLTGSALFMSRPGLGFGGGLLIGDVLASYFGPSGEITVIIMNLINTIENGLVVEVPAVGAVPNTYTLVSQEISGPPTATYDAYTVAANDAATIVHRRDDTRAPIGLGDVTGVHQIAEYTVAFRNDDADNAGFANMSMVSDTGSFIKDWDAALPVTILKVDTSAYGVNPVANIGATLDGLWKLQDVVDHADPDTFWFIIVPISDTAAPTDFVIGDTLIGAGIGDMGDVLTDPVLFQPKAGGRMSAIDFNFYAGANTNRLYMADGVNPAMYFDPVSLALVPICTDYATLGTTDTAVGYIAAFQSRLVLSTLGGGFITSVGGDPLVIDGTLGSIEIGVGDFVTGFKNASANELLIFTKDATWTLSGNSPADWQLRQVSASSGAKPFCVVDMGQVLAADDVGIVDVSRSDKLGGFSSSTVTNNIKNLYRLIDKPDTCSTVVKGLEQMRFFFGTTAVYGTRVAYQSANGNDAIRYGFSLVELPVPVLCVNTGIREDGTEHTIFGSNDGFVYKMDSGPSFNGADITSNLRLSYNHFGSPQQKKRFEYANLETASIGANTVTLDQRLNYGDKTFEPRTFTIESESGEASGYSGIDVNLTHNSLRLRGTGRNIRLEFTRASSTEEQLSFTGYTLRYTPRGLITN